MEELDPLPRAGRWTDDTDIQLPAILPIDNLADQQARDVQPAGIGGLVRDRRRRDDVFGDIDIVAGAETGDQALAWFDARQDARETLRLAALPPIATHHRQPRASGIFPIRVHPLLVIVHQRDGGLRRRGGRLQGRARLSSIVGSVSASSHLPASPLSYPDGGYAYPAY